MSNRYIIESDQGLLKQFQLVDGIVAFASGGQASATLLTSSFNIIATVATTGDSVKMPIAKGGYLVVVINDGANACDVFPNTGDDLGAGVDTAVSLAAGNSIMYFCKDSTTWKSI
jgi:hypothetical protein